MSGARPLSATRIFVLFAIMSLLSGAYLEFMLAGRVGFGLRDLTEMLAQGFVAAAICGLLGPWFLVRRESRRSRAAGLLLWAIACLVLQSVAYWSMTCCEM